jgi:pimeloyl-ACP methyl ester carboxylesterase
MLRFLKVLAPGFSVALGILTAVNGADARKHPNPPPPPPAPQETGFLNRTLELHGSHYHFQVYLPEDFHRDDHKQWPIILFLHGRGERGAEGMWQTQIGLPLQVRDHPERWPFIIVLPQCTYPNFWTDPDMLKMAMAELDQETNEFHADPARTYLTGLSMGGYGAWELARNEPHRWAAIAIIAGGPFWSYAPERWQLAATMPGDYARIVGHTPVWLFHGSEDNVVPLREADLMYNAVKANSGHIRLWIYQGMHHDSWARAYNEPELPRWLLAHRLNPGPDPLPFAERITLPLHPNPLKLAPAALDAISGEYHDTAGHLAATLFRQGEQLYEKDPHGEVTEVEAESSNSFFYPNGSVWTRLVIERDPEGHVTGVVFRDDRHEEHWERKRPVIAHKDAPRPNGQSAP